MKIILAMVMSLDGKITRWDKPSSNWASKEDQDHFFSLIQKNNLIIMGSKTYFSAKNEIKLSSSKKRIVLTRNPQKYSKMEVAGQLEFTNEKPGILIQRLENQGYKEVLLLGGGEINSLFFESNLVDEIYLTVEPEIFGSGLSLVSGVPLDVSLKLKSFKKLNSQGTLLLHYVIKK